MKHQSIRVLIQEYFDDLKNRSEFPDTIVDNGNEWRKRDSSENAVMREQFSVSKRAIIKQWEIQTGISWPVYACDVYSESGRLIRKAGDRYDAHHVQPLTFGGDNSPPNITPLHAIDHFDKKGVHAPNSPYGRIGLL
jgi:hypothetical protein